MMLVVKQARLALATIMVALVGVTLASCGSSTSSAPAMTSPAAHATATVTVTIRNFAFHPATLHVSPAELIKVTNEDSTVHTLTALPGSGASFNTRDLAQGQSATISAPTRAGTYAFYCQIHSYMRGELVVS